MARRPYYRVKYDEANGFEYPYYDIKFDKRDYIPPTPSITPSPSNTPIPCPDYVCLDFSEPSLQDYNGAYYEWTRVYKGASAKINCDGYYYGYKGTTLNGKSGLIYYDGSDWIAALFAPSTTINCNDDITATNPNYISERVLTSAVSQCEYTYYRPDFSSFSGGSEECIIPTPSVTPTNSITPTVTPSVSISVTPSISITPSATLTPTPTPSASVPAVPQPLQYTIDTSLGDGLDTVYSPALYRSTSSTDAVYVIDWGDSNDELLYFNDSPSYTTPKQHTYSSGGTYTISIKCSNSVPWTTFDFNPVGISPSDNKVTAITDWGNQIGEIASPFNLFLAGTDLQSIPSSSFTSDLNFFTFNPTLFENSPFSGDVTTFDVSTVTSLGFVFQGCNQFNQDLNSWDTSNVTNMNSTFYRASSYNQPLTGWTTSGVTNMSNMFFSATSFNGDITNWDVSSVTTFKQMFEFASSFNQNIGSWNVSGATNMFDMFASATTFNQDLSSWDVSNVTDFDGMFSNATSFNQSLANWDISSATVLNNMLNNCGMSTANYDATLIGWEAQAPPTGLTLGAQGLTYTLGGAAQAARTSLISTYGWTITGDSGV